MSKRGKQERLKIWAHDQNPDIDYRLMKKPRSYCADLVAKKQADWLPGGGIQLRDPKDVPVDEHLDSRQSSAAITDDECINNAVGAADKGKRPLTAREIIDMRKVRNYGKASWSDRVRVVER